MKIKFDHTKDKISEALGTTEKRHDEIYEVVQNVLEKQISKKEGCVSKRIEESLSKLKGKMTAVDYIILGMAVRGSEDVIRKAITAMMLEKLTGKIELKVDLKTDGKKAKAKKA